MEVFANQQVAAETSDLKGWVCRVCQKLDRCVPFTGSFSRNAKQNFDILQNDEVICSPFLFSPFSNQSCGDPELCNTISKTVEVVSLSEETANHAMHFHTGYAVLHFFKNFSSGV